MRLRPAIAGVLCAALVGTAACGGGESTTEDKPAANAANGGASAGAGEKAVPETLSFTATTIDGERFEAASLAGKPTVLWFWAPWCATCAGMAFSVSDAADRHSDRVNIVGVAGMGDAPAMHDFVKDTEVGAVTHLNDQSGEVFRRFKITEQSTYVLIDKAGKITFTGFLDDLSFLERVKAMAG